MDAPEYVHETKLYEQFQSFSRVSNKFGNEDDNISGRRDRRPLDYITIYVGRLSCGPGKC